jgi:hypothetical protein
MQFDGQTLSYDKDCTQEASQLEAKFGFDGEIGAWLLNRSEVTPPTEDQVSAMIRMVRLNEIFLVELRHWMEGWNLGVALEDTLNCARQKLRSHLFSPSPDQLDFLNSLLEEDQDGENAAHFRSQVISQIRSMLSSEEWAEIAQVASSSIQRHVLSLELSIGR